MSSEDEVILTVKTAERIRDAVKQVEHSTIDLTPNPGRSYPTGDCVRAVQITGTINATTRVYPARIVRHDYTEAVLANRWKQFVPDALCWVYAAGLSTTSLMAIGDVVSGVLIDIYADGLPLFLENTASGAPASPPPSNLDMQNTDGTQHTTAATGIKADLTKRIAFTLVSGVETISWLGFTTSNSDGTQVDLTTSTLVVNQATGVATTGTAGSSTLALLAASATQMGAVTTATQVFAGFKDFMNTVGVNDSFSSGLAFYVSDILSGDPTVGLSAIYVYSELILPSTYHRYIYLWAGGGSTGDYSYTPGVLFVNGTIQLGNGGFSGHDRTMTHYGDHQTNKIVSGTVSGTPTKFWKVWDLQASAYVYLPAYLASAVAGSA